jgi:NADP-dependent 3-hydroxy acid dehydrogenase YdfG
VLQVDETLPEDIAGMIQTNVIGLMQMTTAISKGMRVRGAGHIISIGSISGHFSYPGGSVYCASKFAVDGFMRAVQSDFVDTPIRVSVVSPGFAETEFSLVRFKGNADKAGSVYKDIVALTAADCADSVLFAATRPAHVQVGEIIVWPTNQAVGGVSLSRVGPNLGAAP